MSQSVPATLSRAKRRAGALTDDWAETLGRFGYAAKGTVYLIIGYLAARAAFGAGGGVEGSEGVLTLVLRQPFGAVLLGVLALGLAAYTAWRFVQAIADPEARSNESRAFRRIYCFASGVLHAGLVVSAAKLLGFLREGGGSSSVNSFVGDFGGWPVYLVSAVILGVGVRQLYRAYTVDFTDKLSLHEMPSEARPWFVRATRWALTARGVVFGTIALLFFVQANRSLTTESAPGLEDAMRTLAAQPFGAWIFGFLALGLGFYGVFQLAKAYYRVFST